MSITVHPITVDQDTQEPDYTAQDYRRGVNSLLFPSNGSTFNSLNCVSAASPTHILTNTGSVVTVVPHSGFMSPFAGEAAYTYTITDVDGANSVTMSAATGHYKIAVVVTDPSAGQGSAPGGVLAAYSSSTADSAIPGIVLGEYNNGAVTDTAVRWQNQGVLIASSLTQLNTIAAVNGQLARVNGVEYKRENGQWVPITRTVDIRPRRGWEAYQPLSARLTGGVVTIVGAVRRTSGTFTAKPWDEVDIATIDMPPHQRIDYMGVCNGSGSGGSCGLRINTDGIVNIVDGVSGGIKFAQNETWVSIAVSYPIS